MAGDQRPNRSRDQLASFAAFAAVTGQDARVAAARRRVAALRLTDADRDSSAAHLSEQFVLGRLDRDELDNRLELLNRAMVHGELAPVFDGLPMPMLYVPGPRPPARWPWVLAAGVASLALPFLTIGMVLVLVGREVAAAFFVGPALLWMLLAGRWASRRTRS